MSWENNHISTSVIQIVCMFWYFIVLFTGPQLIVHAYGIDFLGNDVVRGYGVCHIPITPGL